MAVTYNVNLSKDELEIKYFDHNSRNYLKDFDINQCLNEIWSKLKSLDEYIQKKEPFKNIKINPKEAKQDVHYLLFHLYSHALELEPFLPETSDKIKKLIRENKKPEKSLFPRKD